MLLVVTPLCGSIGGAAGVVPPTGGGDAVFPVEEAPIVAVAPLGVGTTAAEAATGATPRLAGSTGAPREGSTAGSCCGSDDSLVEDAVVMVSGTGSSCRSGCVTVSCW